MSATTVSSDRPGLEFPVHGLKGVTNTTFS